MNRFTDFYTAWWWLVEHPAFFNPISVKEYDIKNKPVLTPMCYDFYGGLDIDFQKVNPKTRRIDDDETLNTKVECWLECGSPYIKRDMEPTLYYHGDEVGYYHDMDLDCGGDTFEEAIVNLANLVDKYYEDSGERK